MDENKKTIDKLSTLSDMYELAKQNNDNGKGDLVPFFKPGEYDYNNIKQYSGLTREGVIEKILIEISRLKG